MAHTALSGDVVFTRRRMLSHIDDALARLRMQEALRAGALALTVVLWILVPMVLVDRILSLAQLGFNIWIVWGGLACLSIPYILWRVFSERLNERLAAVLADDRLGLHARLCTSLALRSDDDSAFGELFYREAAARLRDLDVARAFPFELPRLARFLPIPVALAAGIWYFMEPQDRMGWVAAAQEKRAAEEARKKTVKPLLDLKLQDLKRAQDDKPIEDSASYKNVNHLLKRAQEKAQELQEGKINSEQALQALAELKRDIGKEREQHAFDKTENRLKNLKDEKLNLEDGALTKDISEALKENDPVKAGQMMRQLARKVRDEILNDPNKTPEQKQAELKKLKDELERLSEALAEQQALRNQLQELSEKTMDAADFQKLQQQLKEQNEQHRQDQQGTQGDRKPGDRQGDPNQGGQAQDRQTAEQQAQKLAEELEEAMQEAADAFDELEEESYQPDETDEALDRLEEQVDNALDGLSPSGGSQAGGQQGQKQGGKKSGQKGSQRAGGRRSGRTGQGMGQQGQGQQGQGGQGQQGQGQGQEGSNQGHQQGGAGLGGGRATGSRPYADGETDFEKEKVRGKMQAGAITALSHFRGQGAKGEAPKEYVNLVNRADQEAASSLELDQVPADARNMVKEYFSTLKRDVSAPAPTPSAGGHVPRPPASGAKKEDGELLRE